jgi:metal-responsive CopG/Arc/MetJ family transcriptional regulator
MSVISLRLPEKLLNQLDNGAQILHIQRAEYIRRAIESMNEDVVNQERKKRLIQASLLVRKNSMRINNEFSDIEYDEDI